MAPNICSEYGKDLYDIEEVIPKTSKLKETIFLLRNRIYKVVEYTISDSTTLSGSLQIFFYDFGTSLDDVYAYCTDNDDYSDDEKIRGILALRLPFDLKIIARYSFVDLCLSINGSRKFGKQIKGAFVDPDHASIGLTTYAYKYLFHSYNLLISDNQQTLEGYGLWLDGVSSWSRVLVYDIQGNEVICEDLDIQSSEILPWKLPDNFNEKDYRLTQKKDCRFYIVLFIMQ